MSWVEVSLSVPPGAASSVADVLADFAPNDTVITGDFHHPETAVIVQAFLPESVATEEVRRRIRKSLGDLAQILPLPEPSFRTIDAENRARSWMGHHHGKAIGRRLQVLPTWIADTDPARIPVRIDPGSAFGTGSHPTTQMCLVGLEDFVRPGDVVVDMGCGSGILSIAAVLLGASRVLACDIDEDAVTATRQNAELNGVGGRVEVFRGSLPETAARLSGGRPADLLAANIPVSVINTLLCEGMANLVRDGGTFLFSGIMNDQRDLVDEDARKAGLVPARTDTMPDWRTLTDWCARTFRKETPPRHRGGVDVSR